MKFRRLSDFEMVYTSFFRIFSCEFSFFETILYSSLYSGKPWMLVYLFIMPCMYQTRPPLCLSS